MVNRFLLLLLLPLVAVVRGEESLAPEAPLVEAAPEAPAARLLEIATARRAQEMGFSSVAAAIYRQVLESMPEGTTARNQVVLALTTAYLDEGRMDLAQSALALFTGEPTPAVRLRDGLIAVRQGRTEDAQAGVARVRPGDLTATDRGWLFLLHGLIAEAGGDYARAGQAFQQAAEAAVSGLQRARFELARERSRIERGDITAEQAATLKQNADRYQGRSIGYDYARQYATALAQLDRRSEAVAYLQSQLAALPDAERSVRDDLRLLLGLIAGPGTATGREALEGLLTAGSDRGKQRAALQIMTGAARSATERAALRGRLDGLITATDAHPILEDLLLARADLTLASQEGERFAKAEADARALLTRFPNSTLKAAALAQLAKIHWELRRYRSAADYAAQARTATQDRVARASLGVLIAEAYFRAGDFRSAAVAYAAALETVPAGVSPGGLIFQRVVSEIAAERLNEAEVIIDQMAGDPRFDVLNRWRAEWNLARALDAAARTEAALTRVVRLRGEGGDGVPAELRVRMAWLEARLALDAGMPQRALELTGALPAMVADGSEGAGLGETLRSEITGMALLLEAEANFELDRPEAAVAGLARLREQSANTDAKMRSFLVEAAYYASVDRLVDAQRLLTSLADDHRANKIYAPQALYGAASAAERRGQAEYYQQAFRLLERLVQEHPGHALVFYARMKQGDLARRLNDFPLAQRTYEFLVNEYRQHGDVMAAELALAATHRAQSAPPDVSHFESALTIFERLRDLTNAPVDLRIEAGFQLGDMLAQRGRPDDLERAKAAWWPLVAVYLLNDEQASALGAKGRYWMARLVIRQAEVLESEGRREEARQAYRLIIDKNLPGAALARTRLGGAETAD